MTQLIKKLSEPKIILLAGVVYTLIITYFLLSPVTLKSGFIIPFGDKIIHILVHTLLAALWLSYSYSKGNGKDVLKNVMLVLMSCILYGIIIEILQKYFTISRTADIMDVVANIAGSTLGFLIFWKLKKFFRI